MALPWGEPCAPLVEGWITCCGVTLGLAGNQMGVIILLKILSSLKIDEMIW